MSSRLHKNLAKSFPLSALALGMGLQNAHALEVNIVNMVFNSEFNASGVVRDDGTGSFTSVDPFYSAHWTANVVSFFDTTGVQQTYAGTSLQGPYNYQFTLAPGQVAWGTKFNWNMNNDIPVLSILDCGNPDLGCRAAGPDASGGVIMQTPPFQGQAPAFNGPATGLAPNFAPPPPPIVLAADRALNAQPGVQASWTPPLAGTLATPTCTIDQDATNGTATVQADCSSGTFTSSVLGTDTFVYKVSSVGGTDTGIVTVTVGAGGSISANPDAAVADVATVVDIDVLANDTTTGGLVLDPASVTLTQQPTQGTASVNATTGAVSYQPNAGYCGPDSMAYSVADTPPTTSDTASITVTVNSGVLCSSNDVTITGGSVNPGGDGMVSLSELISAGIPTDNGVTQTCVGGCFDFRATGLAGPAATFILPLSEVIPAAPLMRKWNGSAWVNFVEGPNDSIASTSRVDGLCPASIGYTAGLAPDNDCIRMIISDGGPNDADGVVNGEILDPSGVGKDNIPSVSTSLGSESGCSIGGPNSDPLRRFDWAVLFGFVGGLWFWRKGARRPQ